MRSKSMLCGLLFLIGSGGCELTWKCPAVDTTPSPLKSGTYEGSVHDNRVAGASVTVTKQVVVNREAGTATITFTRDGKQVVETWKLSPSS